MCRRQYIALVMAALGLLEMASGAAPLVEESFSYPSGTALHGANGGAGWSDAWSDNTINTDGGPEVIMGPGLTFLTLATAGNRLVAQGDSSTDSRIVAGGAISGTPGTTRWIGFLLRKDANGDGGAIDPDYAGIDLFGRAGAIDTNLYIGAFTTGRYGLGGGGVAAESGAALTLGVTDFVVAKITFTEGNETVELFLNPTPGSVEPSNPIASKSDVDFGRIDTVGIENGFNAVWSFDELRLGETFAAIAPVPEATSAALLVAGAAVLASRGRFRRHRAPEAREC